MDKIQHSSDPKGWEERLNFLLEIEPRISDSGEKFQIRKEIEETQQRMMEASKQGSGGGTRTLRVFFSHAYAAFDLNNAVFDLLSMFANIKFDVDAGEGRTNVTRLERMVAEADAFVGVYPYNLEGISGTPKEIARVCSKYFRLELDIAIRSKRPTLIFLDDRYGNYLEIPSRVEVYRYNASELPGRFPHSDAARLLQLAKAFCEQVFFSKQSLGRATPSEARTKIGLCLPNGPGYSPATRELIFQVLKENLQTPIHIDTQASGGKSLHHLQDVGMAVVDVGPSGFYFAAMAHAHFTPLIRLSWRGNGAADLSPLEAGLMSDFEVGYRNDFVRWSNESELEAGLRARLKSILARPTTMHTEAEAKTYFEFARRKRFRIFVSYASEDRPIAQQVVHGLRSRFPRVFDFRDKVDAPAVGSNWRQEIQRTIQQCSVAIQLVSSNYLDKQNCVEESNWIQESKSVGTLIQIPIKLRDEKLSLPPGLEEVQYLRFWDQTRDWLDITEDRVRTLIN